MIHDENKRKIEKFIYCQEWDRLGVAKSYLLSQGAIYPSDVSKNGKIISLREFRDIVLSNSEAVIELDTKDFDRTNRFLRKWAEKHFDQLVIIENTVHVGFNVQSITVKFNGQTTGFRRDFLISQGIEFFRQEFVSIDYLLNFFAHEIKTIPEFEQNIHHFIMSNRNQWVYEEKPVTIINITDLAHSDQPINIQIDPPNGG